MPYLRLRQVMALTASAAAPAASSAVRGGFILPRTRIVVTLLTSRRQTTPLHARSYATPSPSQMSDALLNSSLMRKMAACPEVMEHLENIMRVLQEKGLAESAGKPSMMTMLKLMRDRDVNDAMQALKTSMDKNGIEITVEEAKSMAMIFSVGRS
ncbi:uncharacterized protein V1518DRAFT_417018 [Limtongia smithiae]|uniref:uncharacterized protein n=1 Tax=Limtongia smithiae TaxID=1125753 RepID=UPI0034CE390A